MKQIYFDKIVVRASQIHKIMAKIGITDIQAKTLSELMGKEKLTEKQGETLRELTNKERRPDLPDGFISYAIEVYKTLVFNRYPDFENSKTKKGNNQENESIITYSKFKNEFYEKNTKRKTNDFFTGECDIIDQNQTIDIKSAYDLFSLPSKVNYKLSQSYYYQGQVYMDLFGTSKHTIAHVLVNNTSEQIENEIHRLQFQNLSDKEYQRRIREIETKHIIDLPKFLGNNPFYNLITTAQEFEEIPIEFRIKEYTFEKNEVDIQKMKERVKMFRSFISENYKNF